LDTAIGLDDIVYMVTHGSSGRWIGLDDEAGGSRLRKSSN